MQEFFGFGKIVNYTRIQVFFTTDHGNILTLKLEKAWICLYFTSITAFYIFFFLPETENL